jgi:hypothetical protein
MLWRQSTPPPPLRPTGPVPVPDINALRQAALQASTLRGRKVAQRRVALRWLSWFSIRLGAVLATTALAWLWAVPELSALVARYAPHPADPAMAQPAPRVAAPPPASSEPGLQLRPADALLPAPQAKPGPKQPAPPGVTPSPQLKPDNWLHSQEP